MNNLLWREPAIRRPVAACMNCGAATEAPAKGEAVCRYCHGRVASRTTVRAIREADADQNMAHFQTVAELIEDLES